MLYKISTLKMVLPGMPPPPSHWPAQGWRVDDTPPHGTHSYMLDKTQTVGGGSAHELGVRIKL